MHKSLSSIIFFGVLAFAGGQSAQAQDAATLKLGTHNCATCPGSVEGGQVFMKAAEKASNNLLKFEFYPGEQAGKANQMFDLVKVGAVDLGYLSTGYTSNDKLPLIGVWQVPGLAKSACSVVKAMNVLGQPGGLIYESDFKPNGLRILSYLPYPAYVPTASLKPITSVDSLKGMKLRSAGGLMDLSAQAVGGVPVKMSSTEILQSLQRGTLDAVLISYLSVKSLDLGSVAKYGTAGYSFGIGGDMIAISEARFQALTKEQQDALVKAGEETSDHWCHYVDEEEVKNLADMKAAGMDIHEWSEEDKEKLAELTADIPADWAKSLDERGKPGSEVLKQFTDLLQE